MSNDVLEAVESSTGLLGDLCKLVLDYLRELPRPYNVPRPLDWGPVFNDDRNEEFGSYQEDLITLSGLSFT